MAEEILLDYVVDQPYIPTSNAETGLKILFKVNAGNALRQSSAPTVGSNLALVLDVSSSMKKQELSGVKDAAKAALAMLRPGDVVSVIAFQSVVYEIIPATRIEDPSQIAALQRRVDVIDAYQGGGTNMEQAISRAEQQLHAAGDGSLARKIILFTDGQVTGLEQNCLQKAAEVSARGVSFDALGFGKEFDYKFMQNLVGYSNGFTEKIDRVDELKAVFQRRVAGLTSAVAANVTLSLSFIAQVRAGRGYRYAPEMNYLGNIRLPGEQRTIQIPLGTIERDKEYSYLLTCSAGQREAGQVRIIKAELTYDIPALGIERETSTQSIIVTYTDDPTQTSQLNGEVERVFDEVEIGRMVEQLDKATAAKDHSKALVFFDILAKRYEELGDTHMQQHYLQLKDRYVKEGAISQEDMNTSRHKSTQRRDSAVQLVDASSLI